MSEACSPLPGRAVIDSLYGRVVILVDDGLATGYTARAAIEAVRRAGARRIILAVPVAPEDSVVAMRDVADEVVVVDSVSSLVAIGDFYEDFAQTSDEEVVGLLERAAASRARALPRTRSSIARWARG